MTYGASPNDEEYDDGAGDEGFDDQPIEEGFDDQPVTGFDDEPLEYDPYAASASETTGGFPTPDHEYDAAGGAMHSSPLLRRRASSGGALGAGLFVLLMLAAIPVLGIVIVMLYLRGDGPAIGPRERQIDLGDRVIVVRDSGPPRNVTWSQAGPGKAQKIRDVAVEVAQVSVGKVRARDESNRVVYSGNEYLRIGLTIENWRAQPYDYVSWYGREVEQFSGPDRARLFDAEGNELTPHVFADVRDLEGHTPAKTLETRDSLRDSLYFDLPEGKDVAALGDLRLQLPLESKVSDSAYRFKIPATMIVVESAMPGAIDPAAPMSDEDLEALTGGDAEATP